MSSSALSKIPPANSDDGEEGVIVDNVVSAVNQILENIRAEDAPFSLESAYVYVQSPHNLASSKAVVVIAFYSFLEPETADMTLFTSLISNEMMCSASESFERLKQSGKTIAQCIASLVDEAVIARKVTAAEAPRLKSKFSLWMSGVTAKQCTMSSTNRPSLASWNGWPWDSHNVADRALTRSLVGKNVVPAIEMGNPESIFNDEAFPALRKVWSAAATVPPPGAAGAAGAEEEALLCAMTTTDVFDVPSLVREAIAAASEFEKTTIINSSSSGGGGGGGGKRKLGGDVVVHRYPSGEKT